MRKLRFIAASLLAMLLVPAMAGNGKKDEKVLYESYVYNMNVSKVSFDEKTMKTSVEWPSTECAWVGGNKIITANKMDIVKDYSVFTGVGQKSLREGVEAMMSGKIQLTAMFWRLTAEKKQTVLHCYFMMPADEVKNMWLGGADTYIVDRETGIHYKPRKSSNDVLKTHFTLQAPKGSLVDISITFPPLPESVKKISIYGIPNWYLRGDEVTKLKRTKETEPAYDPVPQFKIPRMVAPAKNYDKNNHDSWARLTDVHTIKPVPEKKEKLCGLWRTQEATYLAIPKNHNWCREYYGVDETCFLIDNSGRQYKIKSVQGFTLNQIAWVEETAGDWWAQVLVFEPLPLDVNTIHYIVPDSKPFKAWGANWKGKQVTDLDVEELRDNQKYFEYFERVVVE